MLEPSSAPPPTHPYRDSVAAAVAAALFAGLVVAAGDALLAHGAGGGSVASLLLIALGLYALPSLAFGVGLGIIAGAWRTSFGEAALTTWLRRLRDDRALDVRVAGGLLAGGMAALLYAGLGAEAALRLVGSVARKGVGAELLAVILLALLPACAALALPMYRVARRIARVVPRLGPLPGALVVVLAAPLLGVVAVGALVAHGLDWRALDLGIYFLVAAYVAVLAGHLFVWHVALPRVRRRIPGRGPAVMVATLVALLLPVMTLRGSPSADTAQVLTDRTTGARVLVSAGRALLDRDHDGYSAFLGGPDCDDGDAAVHPGAFEVPDNGKDDNCLGGDAHKSDRASHPTPPPNPPPPALEPARNLIVIAVDTLRADRLGVSGYRRDDKSLTPRLDALAAESTRFTHVWAQAPNTPRSFPSLFTSQYPSQVKVDNSFQNYSTILDDNQSVWESLRDGGLRTVGISSHFYFTEERGIRQGFVEYDNEGAGTIAESNKDIASPRIVPKVEAKLTELSASGTRFAMFVHLFEPHSTYMEHEGYPITETGTAALAQKYDYEVAFVDVWIGRILDAVARTGLADDTAVVVVSDHGEGFGVHRVAGMGMYFHGQTLYDELLRVPLIVRMPGVPAHVVDQTAMLIDVAPTLLDLVGVATPDAFRGRSLAPLLAGQPLAPRPAFAELLPAPSWNHAWKAAVSADGTHKLIYRISDNRFEYFDLVADPREVDDLWGQRRDEAAALQSVLTSWIESEL